MKLIDPIDKTNWKFIGMVVTLGLTISLGLIFLIPQLRIDKCLDHGGVWDYRKNQCKEFTRQPCDLDGDGDCDRADYEIFSNSIHMCSGDPPIVLPETGFRHAYNPLADADHSRCVDGQDQKLLFPLIPEK